METIKTASRDAWIGEGGNPRTNQRAQFVIFDNVAKTKHTIDLHYTEQQKRNEVTFRPDGEADRLNPEQQLGRQLHISDVVKRIQRMNPAIIFQVTTRDTTKGGFYVHHRVRDARTGRSALLLKLVSGCENGWMPEFSVMGARMEEAPTENATIETKISHAYEKTRGWRTVLAKLYVARLITEAQIEKEFQVSGGRSSALWQKQMNPSISLKESHV